MTADPQQRDDVVDDPDWPGAELVAEVADATGRVRLRPGGQSHSGAYIEGHAIPLDDAE